MKFILSSFVNGTKLLFLSYNSFSIIYSPMHVSLRMSFTFGSMSTLKKVFDFRLRVPALSPLTLIDERNRCLSRHIFRICRIKFMSLFSGTSKYFGAPRATRTSRCAYMVAPRWQMRFSSVISNSLHCPYRNLFFPALVRASREPLLESSVIFQHK